MSRRGSGRPGSSRVRQISIATVMLLGMLIAPAGPTAVASPVSAPATDIPTEPPPPASVAQRFPIGSTAFIDVSVATLWREPGIHRKRDRAGLQNPVQLGRWNQRLRTTDHRRWLTERVQTQALYGQQVLVRAVAGSWVKVAVLDQPEPQDEAGYPGWLPARQLLPNSGQLPTIVDSTQHLVVVAKRVRLRTPVGPVPVSYGTRLLPRTVEAPVPGRVAVHTPRGPGSVRAAAVTEPKTPSAASILADGSQFIGLRYLWGGLSGWGMDCSGLIWNVFRTHGMTIPRDADPQYRSGKKVRLKRIQPGDLLFWGSEKHVHHVALYVGKGKMLEAPDSSGRVRIVPIRWRELIAARRYLP
jgi:cell wall-associated NlpC family hydrolase